MTLEPYTFVRTVTFLLAALWTVRGAWRALRFVRRWERRLASAGLPRPWLRRQVLVFVARTTVLDPLNLALGLVLVGLWSL